MNYITEFIKNTEFSDKVVFGEGITTTISVVKGYFSFENEKIGDDFKTAIIAKESDFLLIGKSLKDRVISEGISCDAYVFESLPSDFSFLEGLSVVICLGDADYYGRLAVFAKSKNLKLVCISTSAIFADGLCGFYKTNPFNYEEGSVYKIIVDIDLYKKLKRKDLADGYAFCCSSVLSGYELLLSEELLCRTTCVEEVEKLLNSAYKTLLLLTSENIVGVLVVSQLYIASLLYKMPKIIINGDGFSVGRVLACATGLPEKECVFRLIAPLLTVLKGYLNGTVRDFLTVPNFNFDVEKLAEIFKIPELYIYEKFTLKDFDALSKEKSLIFSDKELIKKIDGILYKYKRLMNGYDVVYRGRHSRADFSEEDKRLSVKLGGLISCGILKVLYDDGFLSVLEDL